MDKGRKHTPEQIVSLLRQIEVATSNGKTDPGVPRSRENRATVPLPADSVHQ